MLEINKIQRIYLGVMGENAARTVEIDVNAWYATHQNASFSVWHKRSGDQTKQATGATFDRETGIISWTPSSSDTYYSGVGTAEIRMTENTVIKKTKDLETMVSPSLMNGSGSTIASTWQAYIDQVEEYKNAAEEAQEATEEAAQQIHQVEEYVEAAEAAAAAAEDSADAAEDAITKYPRISQTTGNWEVWNADTELWVDTEVPATGPRGPQGTTGTAASISNENHVYQVSSSGSTVPTGEWQSERPVTPQGQYLWERVTLTWNNSTTTVFYVVCRMGMDGTGSVVSVCNVSPDGNGNVALTYQSVGAAASSHTHDDRYYTETETDTLLAGKAATSHTHDDRYYTETEVGDLLQEYTKKPIVVYGSLTGAGGTVSRTISDNGITDSMRPYAQYEDPAAIDGKVTITVGTGTVTVTAKVDGTVKFTITLVETAE